MKMNPEDLYEKLMPMLADFAKGHLTEKLELHYPFCKVIIEL